MRVLVLLSGGQDSTTILYKALNDGLQVHAVTIDYNQRHCVELNSARVIARMAIDRFGSRMWGCELVHVPHILKSFSPLVSRQKLEHYPNAAALPGGIEKTFIPLRNQLFLTIAANHAVHHDCAQIWIGVSQEDYGGYPDCREGFLSAFQKTLDAGLEEAAQPPAIVAPLLHMTKADTVRLALQLPGCIEALAYSHTAYDGNYPPTGRDHASLLRARGFLEAGFPDPLVVRAHAEGLMPLPESANYDALREDPGKVSIT